MLRVGLRTTFPTFCPTCGTKTKHKTNRRMPSIKSDGVWTLISTGADNSERLTREFFGIQYLYCRVFARRLSRGLVFTLPIPKRLPAQPSTRRKQRGEKQREYEQL